MTKESVSNDASSRQTFALFCATGKDWRSENLTREKAGEILSSIAHLRGNKKEALAIASRIHSGELVGETATVVAKPSFRDIYNEAASNAADAVAKCKPTPMIVEGYAPVIGGVCGFGHVYIKDSRKSFTKWVVKNDYAYKRSYSGGASILPPINLVGQSLAYHTAWVNSFAATLRKYGIEAQGISRID
jgi:hypothetical protein